MMKTKHETFERILIGLLSIGAGGILIALAIGGPLFLDLIIFRTSPSAIYQTIGQDVINLTILAPLLLVGGILTLRDNPESRYFLVLTPIYLIYMALSYGIGMEWSDPRYTGNSHRYFFLYLYLIITGLLLIFYTLSLFVEEDSPSFSQKQIKVFVSLVAIFLLIFTKMWVDEVVMVIQAGDTMEGSYSSAPTLFWVIRYFDLGITIPLGFLSLYLMLTRFDTAYPLLLMFFGFFVTMIMAVNAMGWTMWLNQDPQLQAGSLVLFGILGLLSFSGYGFLMRDKIMEVTR